MNLKEMGIIPASLSSKRLRRILTPYGVAFIALKGSFRVVRVDEDIALARTEVMAINLALVRDAHYVAGCGLNPR